eukprot:gene11348-11497_t
MEPDVDFGAQVADEVVELNTAHSSAEDAEAKDMQSLLNWAIEHSDPDKLRQQAEDVQQHEAIKDFLERKQRVAEQLSEIISSQKTESQLMKEMIATLADPAASTLDKAAALGELQMLVEPIDNANDLKVLGGLKPLVAVLSAGQPPELQEAAAYVLGTAASNNAELVELLLLDHPTLVQQLLQLAGSGHEGAAAKAMYALGVLVRGPVPQARTMFFADAGLGKLQTLMAPKAKVSQKVKAKALNLVSDLIEMTATGDDNSLDTFDEKVMGQFAASALDLLQQNEALDAKEKALMALRILLLRRGAAGIKVLEDEGAEAILRETLTELDLLADQLADTAKRTASATAQQDGAAPDSTADQDGQESTDELMFAQYVAHLCADVLHQLSIQHAEL